ncbi:MAG: SEC-C domain-containing protein [Mycobacteriaceae bacterium]|nr:SEC-C domain-containing protein [Mycobacteriaceae bacterium]
MTTNRSAAAADLARELDAESAAQSDLADRAALLLEAAEQWDLAGEHDQAEARFGQAIELGGEHGGLARAMLAESLFGRGADERAEEQLALLRAAELDSPAPFHWAAELAVGRERPEEALSWLDLALARIPDDERINPEPDGATVAVHPALLRREQIRRELNLPLDDLDELARRALAVARAAAADRARNHEKAAEANPHEKAEQLIEAAEAWLRADDPERAAQRFRDVSELGGEFGAQARVGLAEALFEQEREVDARAELALLRGMDPQYASSYFFAAVLLEQRGEMQEALDWYDLAAEALDEDELEQWRDGEDDSLAGELLRSRWMLRSDRGLEPDEWDDEVESYADDADWDDEDGDPIPEEIRIPFWPRAEVPVAHRTWPEVFADVDPQRLAAEGEALCRAASAAGVPRVLLVPMSVTALVEFVDEADGAVTDEDVRAAYADAIVDRGGAIGWPPPRNEPCWCGSAVKYKKCCGSKESADA